VVVIYPGNCFPDGVLMLMMFGLSVAGVTLWCSTRGAKHGSAFSAGHYMTCWSLTLLPHILMFLFLCFCDRLCMPWCCLVHYYTCNEPRKAQCKIYLNKYDSLQTYVAGDIGTVTSGGFY